jgi:hypothetical protein
MLWFYGDPGQKVRRLQGIYAISSKFGKFPNIRVAVAREAYKEACPERRTYSASSVPCKYRVLQGHYTILHTFDRVLRRVGRLVSFTIVTC